MAGTCGGGNEPSGSIKFDLILIPRNPYTGIIHGYRKSQRVRTWLSEANSVIRQNSKNNNSKKYKQKMTKQETGSK